jgi:hypothetical protein
MRVNGLKFILNVFDATFSKSGKVTLQSQPDPR